MYDQNINGNLLWNKEQSSPLLDSLGLIHDSLGELMTTIPLF